MSESMAPTIESMLQEQRSFDPPAELSAQARIGSMAAYRQLVERASADPDAFWGDLARSELHWFKPYHTVLDWSNPPFARWFEGGTTNLSYNCLDRHLEGPRADKTALIWEGEPGDTRTFTYRELHAEVCRAANALRALGIGKGDLVALYMPMVPEAAIAMLACARVGAPHSVVFGGFSADALRDRLIDGEAKLVITADGGFRKDKPVPLKPAVDEALAEGGGAPTVQKVLVVQRLAGAGGDCAMQEGRDVWWHALVNGQSSDAPAEPMASEDRLFVLYTSGSTGKP
ncbi:MAG: AMP-binding protein, partial [Cyanobium sp.]